MSEDGPGFRNCIKPLSIFKLVELVFVFVIFMITRFGGGDGNMIPVGDPDDVNAEAFAYMVVFGYQYILIVQCIGILLGEEVNVQNLIYTGMAFIFFLSLGAAQISKTRQGDKYQGIDYKKGNRMLMGSFCIMISFIFLGDTAFTVYTVKKERSSY